MKKVLKEHFPSPSVMLENPGVHVRSWLGQRLSLSGLALALAQVGFSLFLILSLTTPSWRYGPFAWWPVLEFNKLAGGPVELGLLNFLPAVVVVSWLTGRLLAGRRRWYWGRPSLTLPLLGLTAWGIATFGRIPARHVFIAAGGLALAWLVYLYLVNERPNLTVPLSLIVLIQGSVAVLQFWRQGDLGLVALGELPLNPIYAGVTVLWARNQPWLRAYGLTAHPNFLGAILTTLLLLLLPVYDRMRGWRQAGLTAVLIVGLLGLLVSFSRTSWLALATGLSVWFVLSGRARMWFRWLGNTSQQNSHGEDGPSQAHSNRKRLARRVPATVKVILLLLPLLLILFLYRDLVLSRFIALDTPIETRSIQQRLYDIEIALRVIADHPWFGVGLGYYVDAARQLEPTAARVHNVPLLVTAELGFPALLLWLGLVLAPLWILAKKWKEKSWQRREAAIQLAPWLAMIVINLFDTMLWFSSNWQTAILFALLAAYVTAPAATAFDTDRTSLSHES